MDVVVRVIAGIPETPIEEVKVELTGFTGESVQEVYTDAGGRADFRGIAPGSYIIRATKSGFVVNESRTEIGGGEFSQQVEVRLAPDRGTPGQPGRTVAVRTLSIPRAAAKQFRKGLEALKKKDLRSALARFEAALKAFPNYYEAHFMMGMIYLEMKSPLQAQDALQKSVEMEPKFVEAYYPLASLLVAEKKFAPAERLLHKGMELDPQDWHFPFELALCSAQRGRWEDAIGYGRDAQALPNAPSKTHLLMADLYSNTGRREAAKDELQAFQRADPGSPYMPRVRQALARLQSSP